MEAVPGDAVTATAECDAGGTVTVRIPLTFRKRGGRRVVISPDGAVAVAPRASRVDSALVKALARAHRWQRLLERGEYGSIADLAAAERINDSYVSRLLRLTLLAPSIVQAILDGREAPTTRLDKLLRPFPLDWDSQKRW
jgi:hypothetical protein